MKVDQKYLAYVCIGLCVCLLPEYLMNHWMDFAESNRWLHLHDWLVFGISPTQHVLPELIEFSQNQMGYSSFRCTDTEHESEVVVDGHPQFDSELCTQ